MDQLFTLQAPLFFFLSGPLVKLDGVGPLDNRPSTDKLHHFVRKKNKKNTKKM